MMNDESLHDSLMLYGTRAVMEALHSGRQIERLFIQDGLHNPLLKELKYLCRDKGVNYQYVPGQKLARLTRQNHQGVIAFISSIEYYSLTDLVPGFFTSGKIPVLLILDRITDTRNLGAIARTCWGMGVNAILIPSRGSALINADTIKASAGALHHIPVCRADNLKESIQYLSDSGFSILSCTEKGNQFAHECDMSGPVVIIMGSEENGVSEEYLRRSDARLKLPVINELGSYNVSVAAGMILYEVNRQRMMKHTAR